MENAKMNSLIAQYPLVKDLVALQETTWFNPGTTSLAEGLPYVGLTEQDVQDAHARLSRFAPYLAKAFPETAATGGIIESELVAIPAMQKRLEKEYHQPIAGQLLLKKDSHLPISGSIKARGGIYEVLAHAEKLALEAGLLTLEDDYSKLLSPEFKQFFSQYSIAVGSTGNLGLSIGIMSARIGFKVTVHMSADARAWKKAKLRSHGVTVVEYEQDYGVAVEEGRKAAQSDPNCFFIDDENSRTLFLGYSVAGQRLKAQFAQQGRIVNADNPLFVYLPCGVGGGPGGVAFGLKLAFGDHVHCFFAEPTHSPCMLLGVHTGLHDQISVQDIGIDNLTAADGLAVGRASGFVGRAMERLLDGFYTLSDQTMYDMLGWLAQEEGIRLEPSALAGMAGPQRVCASVSYQQLHGFSAEQLIESELVAIPAMQKRLEKEYHQPIAGQLLLKKDSHLPISGSIKARGGIYEVLAHAEKLALEAGLLTLEDDYSKLLSPEFKQFFSQYSIAVGSTGNLGLSIGIMSARIGFKVTVHMSADARAWKKAKLRSHGVTVVEYEQDYGVAVEEGRKAAQSDPNCFFIDDENSRTLFLGYSVAGQRLKAQFAQQGRIVNADNPLFVYLPCGVGGGPGGVAFGLKLAFGDHVHCFFAEPTHSPCMLLGVHTGLHDQISVQDIGIDNLTAADGLAVGRASGFVGRAMERLLDGFYTLSDQTMYDMLGWLAQEEGIRLEPSALAGMAGPQRVCASVSYQQLHGFSAEQLRNATHLVWATGGGMVPEEEMNQYLAKGR
ncbi:D-serine dehydratase 1 [Escherichia coli HVH 28 (4-0907367)]|nr:D-serine dehydratase 1 [Escherichia coli HVH 28 (4-0907367)]